jgi:2-succinyl-6-hydroxy-2,4-cyclohexadiene-1-carboxylate synthase
MRRGGRFRAGRSSRDTANGIDQREAEERPRNDGGYTARMAEVAEPERSIEMTDATQASMLHYEVYGGRGPHMLLVHGFLSSRAQWLLNIEAASAFARPVVVELLGHGRSPSPDDPAAYTPSSYVEHFERVRATVGCERWLVVGQSLGAALTLRYALDRPDRLLAHVFTNSNSALAEDGWAGRVRPAMEAQARRLESEGRTVLDDHPLNPARGGRLPAEVRAAFVEDGALLNVRGVASTGLHTVPGSSSRQRITENRVPTLLVVGERETRFAGHRQYAEAMMPSLTVVGLAAGHAVNIDAAEAFNTALTDFCTKQMERAGTET